MKNFIAFLIAIFYSISAFSQSTIESNNQFSFKVYQKLKQNNINVVFSPFSISSAIGMTYIGAKNNTFDEISNTFCFNKNILEFSESYKNSFLINNKKNSSVKFYNANSIWIQNGLDINPSFLQLNKEYFSAGLNKVDFARNAEKSRIEINNWVEKNTNKKITNLIKPSAIDNTTRLILVNALYFKGSWKDKFNKEKNSKDDFQIGKKKFIETTYMNKTITAKYYNHKYAQIVDIPYTNEDYALTIIIPKKFRKLKKLEKKLNYEFYEEYIANQEKFRINLSLPKFTIESEFDLNKALSELGLNTAFSESADFSGISEKEKLYISKILHKANISVDEEGTEAAAATAVLMRKTSILSEVVDLKINKPFIFLLRNTDNQCIYFMGKIVKPTNN